MVMVGGAKFFHISSMSCFLRYALLSLWLALTVACAQLPEYAQPRKVQYVESQSTPPNGFPYRALTIEDFRAASVPEHLSAHAEQINAHSATQIRLSADSSFSITHGFLFGQSYFFGRILHLAFEAVMIPERSWWNPKIQGEMRAYVLQHEQIHFALTELAARKLSSDSQEWASEVLVIKPTPQEVQAEFAQQIKHMISAAMEVNLKRQVKFDEDTSLFFNPRRQQWWSWTVEDELKQTSPSSR
jgi:hypothetical protein